MLLRFAKIFLAALIVSSGFLVSLAADGPAPGPREAPLTRAEFFSMINARLGYDTLPVRPAKTFSDIGPGDRASITAASLYAAGYGDGRIGPDDLVTWEMAAVMIAKLLRLEVSTADAYEYGASQWAAPAIGALRRAGFLEGVYFHPREPMTAAKAETLLRHITVNVAELKNCHGYATLRNFDTSLSFVEIHGDLLLSESLGDKTVRMSNVLVTGRLIICGGGTIELDNVHVMGGMVFDKPAAAGSAPVRLAFGSSPAALLLGGAAEELPQAGHDAADAQHDDALCPHLPAPHEHDPEDPPFYTPGASLPPPEPSPSPPSLPDPSPSPSAPPEPSPSPAVPPDPLPSPSVPPEPEPAQKELTDHMISGATLYIFGDEAALEGIADGERPLIEGEDYVLESYMLNWPGAGRAYVVVMGRGGYTGSVGVTVPAVRREPAIMVTQDTAGWFNIFAGTEGLDRDYVLMEDIILPAGYEWVAIGTKEAPFTGTFDGRGHTIHNLVIDAKDNDYQGLFGYVKGGTLERFGLIGTDVAGKDYVGAAAGFVEGGVIRNVYVDEGTMMNRSVVAGNRYVGGIAGGISGGRVENSYAACIVRADRHSAGGIVGSVASGAVANCVALNYLIITGEFGSNENPLVGRVAGEVLSGDLIGNYARFDMPLKIYMNVNYTVAEEGKDGSINGGAITFGHYKSLGWWSSPEIWSASDDGAVPWDFTDIWGWDGLLGLPALWPCP